MSYPAIEAKEVRFSYGKNEILHGVDFAAERGQLIAVLGPNGVGKSTLFRCLLGLYGSYRGSITIDGREVKTLQPREIAAKVAYIPQTHTPTFHYTVLEMVLMGTTHRVRGLQSPGEKELAIARGALAQVGIADMERRSYGRLSGGEQQLVLIARALAQQTELLIMDEPTSSLDYGNQLRVMQRIKGLAQQGYTILLSSHIFSEIDSTCDRIAIIKDGHIVSQFVANDLKHASRKYYTVTFENEASKTGFLENAASLPSFNLIRVSDTEAYLSVEDSDLNSLIALLASSHVTTFSNRRETLEDYFLKFYKEDKDFGGALK